MLRSLTPRQLAFDLVTAALCVLLRVAIGIDELEMVVVVLLMATALAARRLHPGAALTIAWIGAIVQLSFGLREDISNMAILPVLYATAAYGGRVLKWAGLISAGAGALTIALYLTGRNFVMLPRSEVWFADMVRSFMILLVFWLVVFGLSWTVGLLVRTRISARHGRVALAQAEEEEAQAKREIIVEQERNRIARDMHDVVAHSLAVVIAQADGARYLAESHPKAAAEALGTISTTAREALGDVRVLLGQLRHNQGAGPQPGFADIDRLVCQMRSSGLEISVEEHGTPLSPPVGAQLAVYRIVQEALTNALRHGDAAGGVTVRFDWMPGELRLTVDSALPGQPAPATPLGHGLAGMRERALLVGGSLSISTTTSRYIVTASIPATPGTATAPVHIVPTKEQPE